jgi:hypothetical protein
MQDTHRHSQRELQDDQERVQESERIVGGGRQGQRHGRTGDRNDRRHDQRQHQPAADLALDGVAVAGQRESAEAFAHHLEQPPPGTADDEAADAQDHHRERRESAEGGEDDRELGDVDDERRTVDE